MGNKLKSNSIILINGAPYRTLPFSDGIVNGFSTGYAYHLKTNIDDRVYPYMGKVKSFRKLDPDSKPGIYVSNESGKYCIIYPKKKDSHMYNPNNAKTFDADSIFTDVNFISTDIDLSVDGDIFHPPIRVDDDMMNKIVKYAIQKKGIVFDAYKSRFDTMGSSGKTGGANTNNKNNAKRALLENKSLSTNKAKEYGDVLEYDIAIAICDKPDASNPMNTGGRPIIIYSGDKFDLSDPISISDLLIDEMSDSKMEASQNDSFDDSFEI